jgi:hypothetical protein
MGMDLTALVTRRYPPGHLYQPEIRTEFERWDPPSASMPHTSVLDDVVRTGENMVENANRQYAAGFPARIRAGESLMGSGSLGVRVSPLKMPEQIRGRMVAVSI